MDRCSAATGQLPGRRSLRPPASIALAGPPLPPTRPPPPSPSLSLMRRWPYAFIMVATRPLAPPGISSGCSSGSAPHPRHRSRVKTAARALAAEATLRPAGAMANAVHTATAVLTTERRVAAAAAAAPQPDAAVSTAATSGSRGTHATRAPSWNATMTAIARAASADRRYHRAPDMRPECV